MNTTIKKLIKYTLVFVVMTSLQLGLLCIVASIPNTYIKKNTEISATYLSERFVFFNINEGDASSRIDRYADSILLNIAYSYDSATPIKSVMESAYYFTDYQNENYNLLDNVTGNMTSPDTNFKPYSRYWHGSNIIIKPMLVFFNLKQIYTINNIILLFLCIALLFSVKKHINIKVFCCLLISMIMISVWYVPMSLEYTWNFMIMLTASIAGIQLYKHKKELLSYLFFIVGMTTCYFDFLTTETITILVPLILIILMKYEDGRLGNLKEGLVYITINGGLWLLGYLLTWLSKWTLGSIILERNIFSDALNQAQYRMVGVTSELSELKEKIYAIIMNLSCVFPFSFIKENAYIAVIISFMGILMIMYVLKKKKTPTNLNQLLWLLSLIPLVRFLVLANHSYMHYFFTYRALISTILCICIIFAYNVDFKHIKERILRSCHKISN